MRILNVAEKNDAAKKISAILSQGKASRSPGKSVYNWIYEFKMNFNGVMVDMVVTSVTGHLMNMNIDPAYKSWHSCDPCTLMTPRTRVMKEVTPDSDNIARTLKDEARRAQQLFLWLDGDREGENIAFEVIQCCTEVNRSLSIRSGTIKRARFSEFTQRAIMSAINNLGPPNERVSMSVDARQELDLRVGAAFTRFQTLHLRDHFANLPDNVISYGPCQFPTLGFVVQRFLRRKNFVVEPFWSLSVSYRKNNKNVSFSWSRGRLFDRTACLVLYEIVMENPLATVQKIVRKEQRRWRPVPLNTVEMQKLAARKLNMSSHKAMNVAESLYNKGLISYPRTETDFYTLSEQELKPIIREQERDEMWGDYAARLVDREFKLPRKGKNNDNAHPPIHPTKNPAGEKLTAEEKSLYELITRHFLATCSEDGIGHETTVTINLAGETFTAFGLVVSKLNWLEVFSKYEKWTDKDIPVFTENEQFEPTEITMADGKTQPPPLLSEADLIGLMDKNGIGTDATIAQHIETIQKRGYAVKKGNFFEPTDLGLALVEAYDTMGFDLSKPNLRAKMESEMTEISRGTKSKDIVVQSNLQMYEFILRDVMKKKDILEKVVGKYFKPGSSNTSDYAAHQQHQGGAGSSSSNRGGTGHNNNANNPLKRPRPDNDNYRQQPQQTPPVANFRQTAINFNNRTANTARSNNNYSSGNNNTNHHNSNSNSNNNNGAVAAPGLCFCGEPVRVFTSKTEKSRGKQFAKCPKPQNEQCKYFEWIDDPPQ